MGITLVALVAFGFWGLPPIVKAQAEKRLTAKLNRAVAIEQLRINPLALSLTVEGFSITEPDGTSLAGWQRLYVNFTLWRLLAGEIGFAQVMLEGFSGRVAIQKDGSFNFSDLIPPSSPPDERAEKKPGKGLWPIRVDVLTVTDARIDFADHARSRPFLSTVGPLSFRLDNFYTGAGDDAPYSFSASTESGESLVWNGTVSVPAASSSGTFEIKGIVLGKYAPYYAMFFPGEVRSGRLDLAGHYTLGLGGESPEFNLRDGAFSLRDLQVGTAAVGAGDAPVIDFPWLSVEGVDADLASRSLHVRRIGLEHGRLNLRREPDGALDILSLIPSAPASGQTPAPARVASAGSPRWPDVRIDELGLSGFTVNLDDLTLTKSARSAVENIDLTVKNIALASPETPIAIALQAVLPPGGQVRVEGTATQAPASVDLKLAATGLPLAGATPYVEPFLNLRIADGVVNLDGHARLSEGVAGFDGNVSIDRFATVDGELAGDFVKFSSLSLDGIELRALPLSLKVARVNLQEPAGRYAIRPDGSTNFSAVLRAEKTPPKTETPTAPAPEGGLLKNASWSVGEIVVEKGRAAFDDRSQKPPVRTVLTEIDAAVTGLSSADLKRADLRMTGKVGGAGRVAINGKIDLHALTNKSGAKTELGIDIRDVDITPSSPYSGRYAGYELERANLNVDVKTQVESRKVKSHNVITLRQFTFGRPTNNPDATSLPVKLAVALLKDTDGNIVIDVPVEGSLDDPEFRIGRVVWRVILNLLTKAATSPFSLIGAMFGGGGEDLAWQAFEPGSDQPLAAEASKIGTLHKALQSRPGLSLDITGSYDLEADTAALRRLHLSQQIRALHWEALRTANPNTPPPGQIIVPPEDEQRIVAALFAQLPAPANGEAATLPSGGNEIPAPTVPPSPETDGSTAVPPAPAKPVVRASSSGDFRPAFNQRGEYRRSVSVLHRTQSSSAGIASTVTASIPKAVETPASTGHAGATEKPGTSVHPAAPAITPEATLEAMRAALEARIEVGIDELQQLATRRAEHVREALLTGGEIAADRLFIVSAPAGGQGVRTLLQLK